MTRPPLAAAVPVAGLAVYLALGVTAMRAKSGTFDEPIHLPPGYVNLTLGDHRMNPDHPPLARLIAAAPLLLLRDVQVRTDDHAWATSRPWEFGKRFLYRWNDAHRLLLRGRLALLVVVGGGLAVAVWAWARRLWGQAAGAAALFLYAFNPDMLAHGQVVANDLAISLFMFLTVAAFERLTERVTIMRTLLAGLALGGALATKFSGLALLPMLGLLSIVVAVRPEPVVVAPPGTGAPRSVTGTARRLAASLGLLLAMCAVAVLVVWASYGFSSPLSPEPAVAAAFQWDRIQPPQPVLRGAFAVLRALRVLPESWIYGFLHFVDHARSRPAFLLGEYSETGWWYYFPVTIALKTPVPLLLLLVGAAVLTVRGGGAGRRADWFVWLPAVVYLALSMTRNINIGHRHVLPLYPFLFVAAARCAVWVGARRSRVGAAALAVLGGWYALGTLRAQPYDLAYFNELAGGPANGYRRLVDSSLDWGQDLIGLKRFVDDRGIRGLKLLYFGTADPGYYGIECERLPGYQPPPPSALTREVRAGDVVAVSATHLQGLYLDPAVQELVARLRALRPLAVIGHTIFVYQADFAWSMP